ncbi:putative ribonuclease H-like domain-containing protein [Tanacetum coccineum]
MLLSLCLLDLETNRKIIGTVSPKTGDYTCPKDFNYVILQADSKSVLAKAYDRNSPTNYFKTLVVICAFAGSPKEGNKTGQEKASDHDTILLPLMLSNSPLSSSTQSSVDKDADDVPDKKEGYANSTNRDSTASPSVSTAGPSINIASENINTGSPNINTASLIPNDSSMQSLENTGIFDDAYDDREVGAEADLNNLDTTMNVSLIPTTRIHKDHPKDQIIGDINSATQTRRMTKISEEHAMKVIQALTDLSWIESMQEDLLQFKLQKVWTLVDLPKGKRAIGTKWLYRNKKDERGIVVRNKARLVAQEEEVYVCQPPGFEDPQFPDKVYKVEKALYGLHQAPRAWYETLSTYLLENGFRRGTIYKTLFIKKDKGDILLVQVYVDDIIFRSTKKSLCVEFEQMMHKRFQMSSMRELTFFLGLQTPSTHMEPNKALVKDEEAENVFQVTPKILHLHAVKRIFIYLKGQPKLGLWYPRDSPFEAFSDSDYAGASLDRKSTTRGCQFLGKRLISWQCKKQTIVANSTTEAEYVATAN